MADIRSTAAEIRRGKKKEERKKEEGKKLQGKNIMAPLLHRAAINIRDYLAAWNPLSYPMMETASLYDNFCKKLEFLGVFGLKKTKFFRGHQAPRGRTAPIF